MRAPKTSRKIKSKIKAKQNFVFDAQAFLDSAWLARKVKEFKKAEVLYSQGDAAESVMYLQEGSAKLTVVNEVGREAVVAILGPGTSLGKDVWQASPCAWGRLRRLRPASCW